MDLRIIAVSSCLALAAVAGCKSVGAPHASSPSSVPSHLVDFGDAAEEAFDAAEAGNWAKAIAQLERLHRVAPQVSKDAAGDLAARVKARSEALEGAISQRDRLAAMRAANELTRLGGELLDRFHPVVPSAVTLLDVVGRDLRIGAEAADLMALAASTRELRRVWDPLKPSVEARGGGEVSARFEAVVARIEAARDLPAFVELAKIELDLVDELENVFKK